MITSITLDGKSGYIGEKWGDDDRPEKPRRDNFRYRKWGHGHDIVFNQEKFDADMKRWREEEKFWKEHNGKYKVECSSNLAGRKFRFSPDKVNLIFGPNASGKSTLLRAMASHAFCTDGWSGFVEPLEIDSSIGDVRHDEYAAGLRKRITRMAGTSSEIEWDGSPIYWHNFENHKSYGHIGDLQGSILRSIGEEMLYIVGSRTSSGGQKVFWQMEKLAGFMRENVTYDDIMQPWRQSYGRWVDKKGDCWGMALRVQEEYYKSFPKSFEKDGVNTYLLDEADKGMDILNTFTFYMDMLPGLAGRYGKQIIAVSHSPVVLSDEIFKSEKYNIISIDEQYTAECRRLLFEK